MDIVYRQNRTLRLQRQIDYSTNNEHMESISAAQPKMNGQYRFSPWCNQRLDTLDRY